MIEISFSGRGGQGVVIASQILGLAFFKAGQYPQCYSVFGGERRGAPLSSFLRVDDCKILLKCEIRNPDEVIYFDDSLLDSGVLLSTLRPGGSLLINTRRVHEVFPELASFRLGLVDGSAIAYEAGLRHFFNTAMVGAYAAFSGHPALEHVLEAVKEMAPTDPELNAEAARLAFAQVRIIEPGDRHE